MILKALLEKIKALFRRKKCDVFYINGSETLPPPLTREQEEKAFAMLETNEAEARQLRITHNLRLVVYIAKKFESTGIGIEDLVSIGTIGLIKAVNTFCPSKNIKLATYASRCIENEILMTMRTTKKHRSNVSLNEPIGVDKDGNELVIMDMLESDQNVIEDVENSIMMEKLTAITKSVLDKREYEIIKMRYGLENTGALTQREVAKKFNISRSYVSRIEKKALEKIKKSVNKEDLT